MGVWRDIEPCSVPKKFKPYDMHFAEYIEAPSERNDGNWYQLFTFRDSKRTIFGKYELIGKSLEKINFEKLATKVVMDSNVKNSMLAVDSELIKLWKRH